MQPQQSAPAKKFSNFIGETSSFFCFSWCYPCQPIHPEEDQEISTFHTGRDNPLPWPTAGHHVTIPKDAPHTHSFIPFHVFSIALKEKVKYVIKIKINLKRSNTSS
ncbi:MAG: hypothetical protein WCZ86_14235 [Desulfurivibrionaceae bacterium]|jgi:hypothetical protein